MSHCVRWSVVTGSHQPLGASRLVCTAPAGTKGEEAFARGPVPAFRANGSKEVGEGSWLDTGLDSVPFEHSSRDDSSASLSRPEACSRVVV